MVIIRRAAIALVHLASALAIASANAQGTSVFQSDFAACKSLPTEKEVELLKGDLRKYELETQAAEADLQTLQKQKEALPSGVSENLRQKQLKALQTMQRLECVRLVNLRDPVDRASATPPTFLEVPIAYATDRQSDPDQAAIPNKDPYKYFTGKLNSSFEDFSFGTVTVSIPTDRKPGELNLPPWWKVLGRDNRAEYFQLRSIQALTREALVRNLADPGANPDSSLLIFVHGFNVSFSEAALRTAQLAHDLSFRGKVLLYSWPSGGNIKDYWTDEDSARISAPRFEKLLVDLSKTGVQRIYIVAHSMGTRIVIPSVNRLGSSGGNVGKVSALLLAAADFNQVEFKDIASSFAQMRESGANVTIYAASNDFALKVSKFIHAYRRLGESDPAMDIYTGLDSVDASTVAPMRRAYGHSYVSDSAQVLGDMQEVILNKLKPADRGLEELPNTSQFGWRIPRLQ